MMRALLLSEYKKLSVVDMPVPSIADDEVLVRVKACGVCGSDIHGYDGSTGRRIPPLVMGHEAAGAIERTGSRVDGFAAGDRVTFDEVRFERGAQRLTFVIANPVYIGALLITALAVWQVTGDGEAAAFEGWALVAIYVILAVLTFYE